MRSYATNLSCETTRFTWITTVADRVTQSDFAMLQEVLEERNPELLALGQEIERERINTAIARKDGLPDVTVGVAYTIIGDRDGVAISENGDDAVLASLSFNVPLARGKYSARVRESNARRLSLVSQRLEETNTLAAELQEALFGHHDAQRRVELYRDTLIPKSTESLQVSLAGFEQGISDFLDLIDTQRTLLEFQLAMERALVDRANTHARIEQLIGTRMAEIGPESTPTESTP